MIEGLRHRAFGTLLGVLLFVFLAMLHEYIHLLHAWYAGATLVDGWTIFLDRQELHLYVRVERYDTIEVGYLLANVVPALLALVCYRALRWWPIASWFLASYYIHTIIYLGFKGRDGAVVREAYGHWPALVLLLGVALLWLWRPRAKDLIQ